VGTDTAAIFIRLGDVVSADRDQTAIADLDLTMELDKSFSLPAVFGAVPSAAEDENHRMLALLAGRASGASCVVGQFVVGEDSPWNNVRSHLKTPFLSKLTISA
jgi:hypothetical protein